MPLTPADVRNKQFTTTRLRAGYDEEEVDAFLEEVEAELDRLIQENEELRAKLAESLRGRVAAPEPSSPLAAPLAPPAAPLAPPPAANIDTAARVLALAQQTADQAVADAAREAGELLDQARRQAEKITSEARARAESLERDDQERHRQAMSSLVQQREELERRVDDLRAFEREYRSRLKAYLEGQLRDLEAGATDSGTFPTVSGPQSSVGAGLRMDSRNGGQPVGTGAYVASPEPAGHGGYHPSDSSGHDRR